MFYFSRKFKLTFCFAVFVSCVFVAREVNSQSVHTWNRTSGLPGWHRSSNWSGGLPWHNDYVYFRNATNGTIYVEQTTGVMHSIFFNTSSNQANDVYVKFRGDSGFGLLGQFIYIGATSGKRAFVDLDRGTHSAGTQLAIRENSRLDVRASSVVTAGTFVSQGTTNLLGGRITAGNLYVSGGASRLNMSGGTLSANSGIVASGGSVFSQSAGSASTSDFRLNDSTYNLTGGSFGASAFAATGESRINIGAGRTLSAGTTSFGGWTTGNTAFDIGAGGKFQAGRTEIGASRGADVARVKIEGAGEFSANSLDVHKDSHFQAYSDVKIRDDMSSTGLSAAINSKMEIGGDLRLGYAHANSTGGGVAELGVFSLSGASEVTVGGNVFVGAFDSNVGETFLARGILGQVGPSTLTIAGELKLQGRSNSQLHFGTGSTLNTGSFSGRNFDAIVEGIGTVWTNQGSFDGATVKAGAKLVNHGNIVSGEFNGATVSTNEVATIRDLNVRGNGLGNTFDVASGVRLSSNLFSGASAQMSVANTRFTAGEIDISHVLTSTKTSLSFQDSVVNTGSFKLSGGEFSIAGGSMTVSGEFDVVGGDVIFRDHASVYTVNSGIAESGAAVGDVSIDGVGTQWANSGNLSVGGTGAGQGTLRVGSGALVSVGGRLAVGDNGTINLDGGMLDVATFELSGSGQLNFQSGTFSVDKVVGDVVQNGGVMAPGDSPGLTEITGNFVMTAGMIAFELAGLSRGDQFDTVDVSGSATLNGTMDIDFIDGFEASLGDSFFLVDAASYSGSPTFDFADASLSGGLVWDTSSFLSTGSISVVAVPEPSAFGVLAALGCVALARRRKA